MGSFFTVLGPDRLFLGLRVELTTFLGSTHVVEQLSFSLFLSILTFDFDLILGSFFTFWALTVYFGVGEGFKKCFGVCSCSGTTFILYVSVISDISILLMYLNNFHFLCVFQF